MNRFILKHGKLVTFVILAILAWFIYRQFIIAKSPLFPFIAIVAVIWGAGTFLFIYFWPAITCNAYKRAILQHGLGQRANPRQYDLCRRYSLFGFKHQSPVYWIRVPATCFISAPGLDLSRGALVLHVPDFAGRYYSLQFTNPADGANFAYVGKRATVHDLRDFLITGPGWQGRPHSAGDEADFLARKLSVGCGTGPGRQRCDIEAVYALTKQVQVTRLFRPN